MNLRRTFKEGEALETVPLLHLGAYRIQTSLLKWGWSVSITYQYGKPGTDNYHAWITAKRGAHGLTLELLYRNSTIKFVGGYWDGGPIRSEKDLEELAHPLKITYTSDDEILRGEPVMATTATPTKRAPRKRAATAPAVEEETTPTPVRKRASKRAARPAPEPEVEFEEEEESGPTDAQREATERREAREAERAEITARIVELREDVDPPTPWGDIAEELGVNVGQCTYFYLKHEAALKGDYPEATSEAICAEREDGMSYAKIQAKYNISRPKVWALMEEGGIDHFDSDIGKGGRYINRVRDTNGEAEKPAARPAKRAAKAAAAPATSAGTTAPRRRGRPPKFKGFTDDTPDDDVLDAVDGKTIEWDKSTGDGTLSAKIKPETVEIVTKRNIRGLKFVDVPGGKVRQVMVNSIIKIS